MRFHAILIVAFFSLMAVGCKPAGVPLAGDMMSSSKCPPGGCASGAPDQNQLSISGPGKTTIYQAYRGTVTKSAGGTGPDTVELGGDCYASTYPNNKLDITVYNGNNPVLLTAADLTNLQQAVSVPICYAGRYSVAINGARMPSGAIYRVHFEIVGIDSTGAEFRNVGTGSFDVNVSR